MPTLESYNPAEVAEGRRRVALGAKFFNEHFPKWQLAIQNIGTMLDIRTMDYCAAAIAARGLVAPPEGASVLYGGHPMYTHGDVCRAYPEFGTHTVEWGCRMDKHVGAEVLTLCWLEAARTIPVQEIKRTLWQRIGDWRRLKRIRRDFHPSYELAY